MSTESERRASQYGPVNRLALALVDIFTGVAKATVLRHKLPSGSEEWIFEVVRGGVQDD